MGSLLREEFTRAFPSFAHTPGSLVADILRSSQRQAFEAGMSVCSEGDLCPGIGFLLSGEVRVFKVGDSGREITLYKVTPGETCILGAASILSARPYPASAMALLDGASMFMPAEEFRRLMSVSAEMRAFIFRLINDRLTVIMELVEDVVFRRMDNRIMEYLLAKAEGGKLRMTHQRIANDLGTSREVVSRLLKDFERRGKVALSRNMIELLKA
jgi:CRP/FNR family transcriptional regulator